MNLIDELRASAVGLKGMVFPSPVGVASTIHLTDALFGDPRNDVHSRQSMYDFFHGQENAP